MISGCQASTRKLLVAVNPISLHRKPNRPHVSSQADVKPWSSRPAEIENLEAGVIFPDNGGSNSSAKYHTHPLVSDIVARQVEIEDNTRRELVLGPSESHGRRGAAS